MINKSNRAESQTTNTILMVRPANFGFNPETAEDNAFQVDDGTLSRNQIRAAAVEEFDAFVSVLHDAGIDVLVVQDTDEPLKTDAVFPNNWITTHASGQVILYPLYAPGRRAERRKDVVDLLSVDYVVKVNDAYLLNEERTVFLEGTGSMILDRPNRVVYASLSERTHLNLLEKWGSDQGYQVVSFRAGDDDGIPYYHTNVIMTLGIHFALICLEAIEDDRERHAVVESLKNTGKKIIEISRNQVLQFAGNALEVIGMSGNNILVMSESAYKSLTQSQIGNIEENAQIVCSPLNIIEKYGGGSARCMMAEIFLPKK